MAGQDAILAGQDGNLAGWGTIPAVYDTIPAGPNAILLGRDTIPFSQFAILAKWTWPAALLVAQDAIPAGAILAGQAGGSLPRARSWLARTHPGCSRRYCARPQNDKAPEKTL